MSDSPPPSLTSSVKKSEPKSLPVKKSSRLSQKRAAKEAAAAENGGTEENDEDEETPELVAEVVVSPPKKVAKKVVRQQKPEIIKQAEKPPTPTPYDHAVVEEFEQLTNCTIYETAKLTPDAVAKLMLTPAEVDPDKACFRIPPSCPDVGDWVFVISLEHIDPDDMSYDDLGKWGRPSGRKMYFMKTYDDDNPVKYISRDKEPTTWDYCIRSNKYNHPGTEEGKKFIKATYLAYNQAHELLGPYALVAYEAGCHPSTLRRLPHASNKLGDKPLIRTKKSTLKQARQMLATHTPKEVVEEIIAAQEMNGIPPSQSDLPKTTAQISGLAQRTPGSTKQPHRGRLPKPEGQYYSDDVIFDGVTQQPFYTDRGEFRPPQKNVRLENMQYSCMVAEKRKHEIETVKLEVETEKLRVELQVMKTKKYKTDVELAKMKTEIESNVVIVDGVEYRHFEEAVQ